MPWTYIISYPNDVIPYIWRIYHIKKLPSIKSTLNMTKLWHHAEENRLFLKQQNSRYSTATLYSNLHIPMTSEHTHEKCNSLLGTCFRVCHFGWPTISKTIQYGSHAFWNYISPLHLCSWKRLKSLDNYLSHIGSDMNFWSLPAKSQTSFANNCFLFWIRTSFLCIMFHVAVSLGNKFTVNLRKGIVVSIII